MRQSSIHQPMTPDLGRVALRQHEQKRSSASDIRRQVIVLLSDGIDTASHVTFDDLLDVVRRADVTIYVVSLATDPVLVNAVVGDRASSESAHALSRLARESGGRLFVEDLPGRHRHQARANALRDQLFVSLERAGATLQGARRRLERVGDVPVGVTGS